MIGDILPVYAFATSADEMRRLRWRIPHRDRARKARVVGGPNNGLLVPVKEKDGDVGIEPSDEELRAFVDSMLSNLDGHLRETGGS